MTAPNTRLVNECNAILRAATRLREYAARGGTIWGVEGCALVNAMHDLTGCDELYELAGDIATDAGLPHEPSWRERGASVRRTIAAASAIRTARVGTILSMEDHRG